MGNTVSDISALTLVVEDLAASKRFYTEVFDLPVEWEDEVSAVLRFDRLLLNLLQADAAPGLVVPLRVGGPDSGVRFQLSVWVDDVDAVAAQLAARGATLLHGPADRPWGKRTVTFADPSGHCWEIAQSLD